MSTRDPQHEAESTSPADPFASSAGESIAATDEFLHRLESGKELPEDAAVAPRSPSSSSAGNLNQQSQQSTGSMSAKADEVSNVIQEATNNRSAKADVGSNTAQANADEFKPKAYAKADQGIDAASSALGSAGDTLRQQVAQRTGTVGTAAIRTADTLDGVRHYLRDKDSNRLLTDLESLVRQKPVESLIVAAGVGFVLSKFFR